MTATARALALLTAALLVGCGESRSLPTPTAASATTQPAPVSLDAHKYDAYGPWQYSVFNGANRDNMYRAATGPTTAPADDTVLLPADDSEW